MPIGLYVFSVKNILSSLTLVSVFKNKEAGNKLTALGHDGTNDAKSKSINRQADLLKTPGYYVEVSGRIKDILIAKGAPLVTDKATIEKVMGDKAIDIQDDGSYTRFIGGKKIEKVLVLESHGLQACE